MNQPPTIPEGDEENEGVAQIGEGTRFPHTGAQQHVPHPPIHETVATASDLQPREDEGLGYGQTPTVQPELVAVSGDVPTDAPQQAEYDQPSSVEHPIIDDGAKEGEPPATDAENELLQPLPEGETLEGITEEGSILREPGAEEEEEKSVPVIEETLDTTPQVAPVEEPTKPDESVVDTVSRIFEERNDVFSLLVSRYCRMIIVDQLDPVVIVRRRASENHHKCM